MINDFLLDNGVLTISSATPYIKAQQFATRDDIHKVIILDGVGFFEEEAFAECENLVEVVLPDSLTNIGVAAFTSCTSLSSINIPTKVKSIEEGAFLFCESLKGIKLNEGLEEIADFAFQASGLVSVNIPSSVMRIGEEAFFECENLEEANVSGEDTSIGLNAFGSNYKLTRGYMAPGFPSEQNQVSDLLFSLLWASCPEKHKPETSERAARFIQNNESLVFERILKYNNTAAMNGIASYGIFRKENIDKYVRQSVQEGLTEITALLIKAKGESRTVMEDFEL